MNAFDIPEISTNSLGIGALVVLGVVVVGTIIYKKVSKKVLLTINNFHFVDSMIHLNVSIQNLKKNRLMVVYHFEYRDFVSKKFSATLSENQTKTIDISEWDQQLELNELTVDRKLFKLIIDSVKTV